METFTSMPNEARTWIYAAHRQITPEEKCSIQTELSAFVNSWTAHNQSLKAEATILYNQFIVIMVDESFYEISGCGIDKSVQLIKVLNDEYKLDFFNRLSVHILANGEVISYNKATLQDAINKGIVNEHSLTFNPLIQTKTDFISKWIQPLHENWISKQIQYLIQA